MPTRSKKAGPSGAKKTIKAAAARKPTKYKRKKSGKPEDFGIDPPIIIDGGGLNNLVEDEPYVMIRSASPLTDQGKDGDYYLYRVDADIKWMDWHGAGHKKDKSKNGKDFSLELHSTDEPA